MPIGCVALRKESVDRNAWMAPRVRGHSVALRKESVDRNLNIRDPATTLPRSLSARRAWIEIPHTLHGFPAPKCRSPQGERG